MKEQAFVNRRFLNFLIGFMVIVLLAAFVVPLTGCGGNEAKKEEVVLRVGTSKPFKSTNRFSDTWYGVLSGLTTHDSLIMHGTDMKPVARLATAWEISADSKQFTFTIAEDVEWHDGVPLTPEDVKFSIEFYRDRISYAGWMKGVVDNVQIEGQDVILNLKKPYANLLTEFGTYNVMPKHIWENVDDPLMYGSDDRVIGSGPFKFESWDETAGKYTFVANDGYFKGKPNVDRIVVNVFKNMDALIMALSRGEIDTWWDYSGEFPYTYVPTLIRSGGIKFASATFLGTPAAIGFNLDRAPTNDLNFRRAVAKAINYKELVDLVFYGYGMVPTYSFVPPTHPNFNTSVSTLEHKPQEARQILDSLGIVDSNGNGIREAGGQELNLKVLTRSDTPSLIRCAELVKQYLASVGIGTQIIAVDTNTWVARKDAMDYDIVFFRGTPWGNMMHASHGSGYFDSRRTGQGVLHNLSAQEFLDTCDARLSTANLDQQRVHDLKLQELYEKYLPGVALAWIDSVYPYREGWGNWVVDHIYGGVFNYFSWFTVARSSS